MHIWILIHVCFAGMISTKRMVEPRGESMGEKPVGRNFSDRKQVTCYGCGQLGHIKPNCPNRVKSIRSVRGVVGQNAASETLVDGWLAGEQVKGLRVDTGAEMTVVHKDFISRTAFTGKSVVLKSWKGAQFSMHRVARIAIQIGEVEEVAEVAVADKLGYPALLGSDLGRPMPKELFKRVVDQLDVESAVLDSEQVRSTRAQVEMEEARDKGDEIASARAECVSIPLFEFFDFSDSYFEQDSVAIPVEELNEWPERQGLDETTDVVLGEQQTDAFLQQSPDVDRKEPVVDILNETVVCLDRKEPVVDILNETVVCLDRKEPVVEILNEGVVFLYGKKEEFGDILEEKIVFLIESKDVSQDERKEEVGVALVSDRKSSEKGKPVEGGPEVTEEAVAGESVENGSLVEQQEESVGRVRDRAKRAKVKMKVKVVLDFQMPQTKKSVRQFLGLTGYDRRFIPKLAEFSYHLIEATGQTAPGRVLSSDVLLYAFLYYLYAYVLSKFFEAEAVVPISLPPVFRQLEGGGEML